MTWILGYICITYHSGVKTHFPILIPRTPFHRSWLYLYVCRLLCTYGGHNYWHRNWDKAHTCSLVSATVCSHSLQVGTSFGYKFGDMWAYISLYISLSHAEKNAAGIQVVFYSRGGAVLKRMGKYHLGDSVHFRSRFLKRVSKQVRQSCSKLKFSSLGHAR